MLLMFMLTMRHRYVYALVKTYSVYAYIETQVCQNLCWKIVMFMHRLRSVCLCLSWDVDMCVLTMKNSYLDTVIDTWLCLLRHEYVYA